jgi:hypothetical protein
MDSERRQFGTKWTLQVGKIRVSLTFTKNTSLAEGIAHRDATETTSGLTYAASGRLHWNRSENAAYAKNL